MGLSGVPPKGGSKNVSFGSSTEKPKAVNYESVLGEGVLPLTSSPITAEVHTITKNANTTHTHSSETVVPGVFTTNGMKVQIGLGRTIATAPYENIKIDVQLIVPCDPTNLGEAYEWGSEWVSQRLAEAEKAAKGTA